MKRKVLFIYLFIFILILKKFTQSGDWSYVFTILFSIPFINFEFDIFMPISFPDLRTGNQRDLKVQSQNPPL